MARIRGIKPDFFKDEDLACLPFEARLFFEGLWCYADKAGRLEDRPKYLKAEIFPYDKVDIEKMIQLLADPKIPDRPGKVFIRRYVVNGRKYIDIPEFSKHQSMHHTEKPSTLPEYNGEITVNEPLRNGETPEEKEKEKEKEKETCTFVLPGYIPEETWKAYLAVRKKKKAESTPYALKLIITELEKIKNLHNQNPLEVLNKSIKSGWVDVYPLKEDYGGNNGNKQPPVPRYKEYDYKRHTCGAEYTGELIDGKYCPNCLPSRKSPDEVRELLSKIG